MLKLHTKDICVLGLLLALWFVSLVVIGFASAQENLDWQKKWQSLLASAKKEGRVVVYGPPGDQIRSGIVQGFTKAFPDLTVEYMGWMLELFDGVAALENGELVPSDRPGLGLTFNQGTINRFAVAG